MISIDDMGNAEKKIEFRSELVNSIIGIEPSLFVRLSIYVLCLFVTILFSVAFFVPIPIEAECQAYSVDSCHVEFLVPYKYVDNVYVGMQVEIKIENGSIKSLEKKCSTIYEINKDIIVVGDQNCFLAKAVVTSDSLFLNSIDIKGFATVPLYNKTLVQLIFR